MRASALAGVALLLGSFAQGAKASQLSVGEVLRKVGEVYQHLQNYQFVAQSEVELFVSREDMVGGTADERSTPLTLVTGSRESVSSRIEFAAISPSKVRLRVRDESRRNQVAVGTEFLVVSDGQTSWAYTPTHKEYTEGAGPLSPEEAAFVRQYWNLLVGRFRRASEFVSSAALEKSSRIKVGGDKIDCYVIKLETEGVTDEMWVDKDRFIVWRLKQTPRANPPEGTARHAAVTLNLTEVDVKAQLDDDLFRFTPPEKATKVESLQWPVKRQD